MDTTRKGSVLEPGVLQLAKVAAGSARVARPQSSPERLMATVDTCLLWSKAVSNRLRVTWTLQLRASDPQNKSLGTMQGVVNKREDTQRSRYALDNSYPSANTTLPLSVALNFLIPLLD